MHIERSSRERGRTKGEQEDKSEEEEGEHPPTTTIAWQLEYEFGSPAEGCWTLEETTDGYYYYGCIMIV